MIGENLQAVRARVEHAARTAGRDPDAVRLLAVSKGQTAESIGEAYFAGQRLFGENYLQEALAKMDELIALLGEARAGELEWHFIGPVQTNKTRPIAERFAWVETIDREKVARRLSSQRPDGLPPLNVLLQVNISGEATKSGAPPSAIGALAREVSALPRLRLRGLMAMPEATPDVSIQHERFRAACALYDALRADGLALDTLSMGMSDDLEAAVAEGSTELRIGTAVFGMRASTGRAA